MRITLEDPKYSDEPVDAFLDKNGVLLLEDEDGERVALSPSQITQLFEWLESLKTPNPEEERKRIAEWNALAQPQEASNA